jgi:hypothetical protein
MTKQNKKRERNGKKYSKRNTHTLDGHFGHYLCHSMSPKWIMAFGRPS